MLLVTKEWVKDYFPGWAKYFKDENNLPDESLLEKEIELASSELMQYQDTNAETINDTLKFHLLVIIKKRGYDINHSNDINEFTPQVVKDYYSTVNQLKKLNKEVYNPNSGENTGISVSKAAKTDWKMM